LGSINLNSCVGSDCCDTGTTWSASKATCVPIQGFTSINDAYKTGDLKGNAIPNSPNEYSKYSKI
jgi:hypothetical protein